MSKDGKNNKNIHNYKSAEHDNPNFLKRWSKLKSDKLDNKEIVLDEDMNNIEETSLDKIEEDKEKEMSDEELFEKYEVANPDTIDSQVDLRDFMGKKIPDRLKQLALRRLWKIVPLYGEVSELVEYGEDFTDAATVIDGMQTAYVIGKGYADKFIEKTDKLLEVEDSLDSGKNKSSNNEECKENKDQIVKKEDQTLNVKEDKVLEEEKLSEDSKKGDKDSESINESIEIESDYSRPSKMVFKK